MAREERRRILHLEFPIESDGDLSALQGALLAARASELSHVRRRGDRLSFGYGSDSAREGMSAEVDQAERRWTMIDRLITALDEASARKPGGE
jgi:hypothetical protein